MPHHGAAPQPPSSNPYTVVASSRRYNIEENGGQIEGESCERIISAIIIATESFHGSGFENFRWTVFNYKYMLIAKEFQTKVANKSNLAMTYKLI
jgi:hypothetical protein